jgi:hypothetical protein
LAQPANPKKWDWVLDVMPTAERVGMIWLTDIYLDRIGTDEANWRKCYGSRKWITDRNHDCEKDYWNGCSHQPLAQHETRQSTPGARWCLIEEAGPR